VLAVAGEDRERRLGDVGAGDPRSGKPVRDRLPRRLVDRVDRSSDPLVLPSSDREPDVEFGGRRDHRLGVERAVGPHRQLPGGAGVPYPADGLGQEALRASGGGRGPAAQPAHQQLPGLRRSRAAGDSRGPWCSRTPRPAWPGRAPPRWWSRCRSSAARRDRPGRRQRPTAGPTAHARRRRVGGRWTTCAPATTIRPSRALWSRRTACRQRQPGARRCHRCCHRRRASSRSRSTPSRRCSRRAWPSAGGGRPTHPGPAAGRVPPPGAALRSAPNSSHRRSW